MVYMRRGRSSSELRFSVDLHGLTGFEARSKLRETIDKCFVRGYNRLRVIHGFGTGVLMQVTYDEAISNQLVKSLGSCVTDKGYTDLILEDNST